MSTQHAMPRRSIFALPLLTASVAVAVAGTARAQSGGTALDIVMRTPQAARFAELVTLAGLQAELSAPGPISVFVPVNAAIDGLPAGTLDRLRRDRPALETLVRNHITDFYSRLDMGGNFESGMTDDFRSKAGLTLSLRNTGAAPTINGVGIVTANITARNGVLHGISGVLLP